MPYYVVDKTGEALNEVERSLKGSKVLILGASYKKDIDDMRESPSLNVITSYSIHYTKLYELYSLTNHMMLKLLNDRKQKKHTKLSRVFFFA